MYADPVRWHLGAPDAAVGGTDQGDGQPTIDVAVRPQVGMILFRHEAAGYAFKRSLHLHSEEVIHQHGKGG